MIGWSGSPLRKSTIPPDPHAVSPGGQNRCLPTPGHTDPARTVLVCRVITVPVEFTRTRPCSSQKISSPAGPVTQRSAGRRPAVSATAVVAMFFCRDHRKMVLQRRPRSLPSWTACGCSPCSSLATTCHSRFSSPADAPSAQFAVPAISPASAHSPRGFCVVSPAVHLPAGKFCPWALLKRPG